MDSIFVRACAYDDAWMAWNTAGLHLKELLSAEERIEWLDWRLSNNILSYNDRVECEEALKSTLAKYSESAVHAAREAFSVAGDRKDAAYRMLLEYSRE